MPCPHTVSLARLRGLQVLAFYLDFESEPEPDEDDLYDLFEADERYE